MGHWLLVYQNGKQQSFWGQVEGRLLPMMPGKNLMIEALNKATQAWCEFEYNRKRHSEIGCTPLQRYIGKDPVGRPCPDANTLRHAFTQRISRTQRKSDGTISIDGGTI